MKIIPECPFCEVKMVELEDENSWKCPDCGGVWTYTEDPRGNDAAAMWRDEQRYKHSIAGPGGGTNDKRKKDKLQGTRKSMNLPWENEGFKK